MLPTQNAFNAKMNSVWNVSQTAKSASNVTLDMPWMEGFAKTVLWKTAQNV